jgi:hypothetical protein
MPRNQDIVLVRIIDHLLIALPVLPILLEDIEIIQNYGWDESDHSAQKAIKQFSVHTQKFV